jgi:peptide/nickel transport system permease protein
MSTISRSRPASAFLGLRNRRRRNPALAAGLTIVLGIVLLAVLAPVLARFPPETANPAASLQPPGSTHWFGTDPSGFDIYSRLLYAARNDLVIGVFGALAAFALGGAIGLIVGAVGGVVDAVVSRLVDLLQSIPLFITALLLVTLFGQRMSNIVIAVTIVYLPLFVRTFRTEAGALMERSFVRSARISGVSSPRILIRHVLPNALAPALGQWATCVGWAILMASGLGFVGAGLKPPTPEWGSMISDGASYVATGQWWVVLFPGAAIAITIAGFTLLSEGIAERLNPVKRR